ncbi:MJ0042-type zinc finger domain-containing protein [Methylobacterium sp. J-076]|uniref:MJ0042-type zinc finger domain-containing protein n=1 Tax=Methylobacterium sp. J-076 TaxID=2836655 RepID=UPI001FBBE436|nr:MJ0042-type zinc finger domain-containing protein [Methylobacterium sp. J-076]MCJ2013711.1 zinc-ribbon domain-containing protein [Methylobacterium sp. J-076]
MLITCPTCASSYRIDAAKIGPEGRSVRCAACRETWFLTPGDATEEAAEADVAASAEAPADPVTESAWEEATAAVREAAAPDTVPDEAPTPRTRKARGTKTRPARRPFAAAALPLSPAALVVLALLAALPVACLARNAVVRMVPQTASAFATVGLPVNLRGLEIRDVVAVQHPAVEDRSAELVVEGDLVGVGRADMPVPALRIEISDAAGKLLRAFPAPAPRAILGTGESARFRARLTDPPAEGRAVVLRFADAAPGDRR